MRNHHLRPQIVVAQSEHRQLLAMAAAGTSTAADTLLDEMERARVVADASLNPNVVRMGSRVQYRTDEDDLKNVTLVYPIDADISESKVSVLTPVGAALIGLRPGQSITWQARDGRKNVLTVLSVIQSTDATTEA
ncbi:nucleoside diphosphate kinase regulator [Arsenicitalea aurantiaca]|uniref:Nucleoside diphosphate kinase regulator n=1 Tax=Arsenicitalea aurantiaca TaxID=1783274 RepID=A0A433X5A7_9HYPH|nr:nucleoside diphosphate kinase regulator [Arsenicitalea aurantiaca]RUT29234.1 nucleoside diphosphate kinase regulator [Arsenicitalea aurantiaca]